MADTNDSISGRGGADAYVIPAFLRQEPNPRRKKRQSWADRRPVHSINIYPFLSHVDRCDWIMNAVLDVIRQLSIQSKLKDRRVSRRAFGRLIAGATSWEIDKALELLGNFGKISDDGLHSFLGTYRLDKTPSWEPRLSEPRGRPIRRFFFRGAWITVKELLAKYPELNVHGLKRSSLELRILDNNWTPEDALLRPRAK